MYRVYQRVADLTDFNCCVEKIQIFIPQSIFLKVLEMQCERLIHLTAIRVTLITSLVNFLQILLIIKC